MYYTTSTDMILLACVVFINVKNNPITSSGGSLFEEANFHPCWPYAQSQLPHF